MLGGGEVKWHCRRGTLELDTILNRFYDGHYGNLSTQDQLIFIDLLELTDPVLSRWLLDGDKVEVERFVSLVERIRLVR